MSMFLRGRWKWENGNVELDFAAKKANKKWSENEGLQTGRSVAVETKNILTMQSNETNYSWKSNNDFWLH